MTFIHKLESQEAVEGGSVTLRCELSKPGGPVEWRRGQLVLTSGEKYQMKQAGATVELTIHSVKCEDTGDYCCSAGDSQSTAFVKITGKMFFLTSFSLFLSVLFNKLKHLYYAEKDGAKYESLGINPFLAVICHNSVIPCQITKQNGNLNLNLSDFNDICYIG